MSEKEILERFDRLEKLLLLQKKKLTLKEVALYTGYRESYLYKLTSLKKLPHSKPMNGAIIFDRDEIDAWLSRNKIKTDEEIQEEANGFKFKR